MMLLWNWQFRNMIFHAVYTIHCWLWWNYNLENVRRRSDKCWILTSWKPTLILQLVFVLLVKCKAGRSAVRCKTIIMKLVDVAFNMRTGILNTVKFLSVSTYFGFEIWIVLILCKVLAFNTYWNAYTVLLHDEYLQVQYD